MWPSCFLLTRFAVSPGGYCSRPVSEEISTLLGRSWEKRENPVLVALLQENPLFWEKPVLSPVLIGVGCHFLLFILCRSSGDVCVGKTLFGEKTLKLLGVVARLAICSPPVLGRFLRFQSVVVFRWPSYILDPSRGDLCGAGRSSEALCAFIPLFGACRDMHPFQPLSFSDKDPSWGKPIY